MAEIRVLVDGNEYSEDQFKKDTIRMFDKYRYADSEHMGENSCKDVVCENCPLDVCCGERRHSMFEKIRIVHEWAIEHPIIRNREMLIKTFGDEVLNYIEAEAYEDGWMSKEYKGPKGGKR